MTPNDNHDPTRLGAILLWKASLRHSDLVRGLVELQRRPNETLGDVLVEMNIVSERLLGLARALQRRWRSKGPSDDELFSFARFALNDSRVQAVRAAHELISAQHEVDAHAKGPK